MRYVKAGVIAPLAILVTLLLLFLMYSLINRPFVDPKDPSQTSIGPVHMPEVQEIEDIYDRPQRPKIQEQDDFQIVENYKEDWRPTDPGTGLPPTTVDPPEDPTITIDLGGVLALVAPVVPDYPIRALERNIEGAVTLRFTVTAAGTVRDVEIVEAVRADGTPTTIFNNAAIRAVQRFRYSPQMEGDHPVEVVGVTHRLVFEIQGS